MYMASDSLFDEFISHFIENLGPGSAFSCILDVQFLKNFSGYRRKLPRLKPRQKEITFLVGKSADQNFVLVGANINYMVYGFPSTL